MHIEHHKATKATVNICNSFKANGGQNMNRQERETCPEDSFDCGYHLYAQEQHKNRVAKNPDRIAYAIDQFDKNNIKYELKNASIGHFHCFRKSDGKLYQFWAGTGKILGYRNRGINLLIRELLK